MSKLNEDDKRYYKANIAWTVVVIGGIAAMFVIPMMFCNMFGGNTLTLIIGCLMSVVFVCGMIYIFEHIGWLDKD